MAQTQPQISRVVDQWFNVLETVLSAQRSLVKATLEAPPLIPLSDRLIPARQTSDERVSASA